jgi:uncharacterized membrane protein
MMGPSPAVLDSLQRGAEWLRVFLALCGAAMILAGAAACLIQMAATWRSRTHASSAPARLELARYVALALEFQLAADVVETSVTPDWTRIGHLAAVGAIRTALNYFLSRDMADDRRLIAECRREAQPGGDESS